MLRFIAADLRRQWAGALAILLLVALATALGVVVTLQERALRLGSARAADAFDLVVGAPGSETQLVLSSVFLQAAALPLLPGTVLAGLIADPRVAWAAPVGFGDFIEGYPIVGTTPALVEGIGGLAQGRGFARLGEAVIGANVGMRLGDHFHPQHGRVGEPGGTHTEITYHVVGRLPPTGTPWDRAVLVPIETVWLAHHHDEADAAGAAGTNPFLRTGHSDATHEGEAPQADPPEGDVHNDEPLKHEVHSGETHAGDTHVGPTHAGETLEGEAGHPDALDAPIRAESLSDPHAPGVPAIVVKPRSIADAYKLRQAYRTDHTWAVFPGEVLTRLYSTLGDVRLVLSLVASGAQALVGAAILLVVTIHVVQRRRQIGALRALGAPRLAIFAIVWGEVALIATGGLAAGFALGYGGALALSSAFSAASGVSLPVAFVPGDLARLAGLVLAAAIVASLPAVLAYRQSPAAALRG
ncbi:putative ABC transport system permease protein [Angulomicrobium tetraedrale]|uniref:Putative ABC transport system permease protein n=1 Tax=Ancylobacter tetraedralis TaxID=217068 RepID=A0A839Z9L5_9HYPH|nr:FtsX-like permease family protein [Ancylobacter tetraedralis]MBB3771317.1 putative ABC transport system permease protein [Ancylobacter tetraedralis]